MKQLTAPIGTFLRQLQEECIIFREKLLKRFDGKFFCLPIINKLNLSTILKIKWHEMMKNSGICPFSITLSTMSKKILFSPYSFD